VTAVQPASLDPDNDRAEDGPPPPLRPSADRYADSSGTAAVFPEVRRIAVLRAGRLGDLVLALPAVRSLAAAYPDAEVTVLGAAPAELLRDRPGAPHHVVVLPPVPGVGVEPDVAVDDAAVDRAVHRLRAERFDLAVQLHGGGLHSNPFLLRLGAAHTVGSGTPDAPPLERQLDYTAHQHELLRALEVVALAGAAPVTLTPTVPVLPRDEAEAGTTLVRHGIRDADRLVVVHPGATDPRLRWPAERFADVTRRLLQDTDARVLLVGGSGEVELCDRIVALAGTGAGAVAATRVSSAAGRLSLSGLVGTLARADVVLADDSGPRHLAEAVGTPTVSVYWFGNLITAGPLLRARHRVHVSWTARCPVCGTDCTASGPGAVRCPHEVSFVADVEVEPVLDDVTALLGAGSGGAGP